MKKFLNDFKAFISRGNVVDLAVAVVVGGAFGKIVTSLVNNIIMPLIGLLTGGLSFEDWKWVIKPADPVAGTVESSLSYGVFIQSIIDFLIISFFIFLVIKIIQNSKNKLEQAAENLKKEHKKTEDSEGEEVSEVSETNEVAQEVVKEADPINENTSKAILELKKANDQSNKKQEKLLEEIRDLLKK